MINYAFYRTKYGPGSLVFNDDKLLRAYLPQETKSELENGIKKEFPLAEQAISNGESLTARLARDLERYFRGENITFTCALDFSKLTDFEQNVMRATLTIPFGETRSYGWVASVAGFPKAHRAAGSALGKNPWPIIVPCHRVVKSDGSLGGWSGEPGWKERLQQLEKNNRTKLKQI
jgi:methylated-DNA-[protein]-cysteine S-methyltransferase